MKFTEEQIKGRQFLLDVIIPQYKETENIIKPLLDSISFQAAIDLSKIGVIIVNDHSDTKLSDEFLKTYKNLNIRYLETPVNRGPGQARQFGIDASDADYIVFADADDRFYACNVFAEVFNALVSNQDKDLDIIYTNWIEELPVPDGRILNIPHQPDQTWVHGKFWRRQFLTERNLRFNENIRVHEDSYFNTVVQMNAGLTANINLNSYYWCYNTNSLTRSSANKYNYLVETADDLVRSTNDTMEELMKRKTPRREEYIVKAIFFMYFVLQAPYWNNNLAEDEELQRRRRRYEFGIFKTLQKYQDIFNSVPREQILQYKNDERAQCCLNTGFETEVETWEQFIARLNQQYPGYTKTCHQCKHYKEDGTCPMGLSGECTMTLDQDYGIYSIPTKFEEAGEPVKKAPKSKK